MFLDCLFISLILSLLFLLVCKGVFLCDTYKYFGHCSATLSDLSKYFRLKESVKFYSVSYIDLFTFMVSVFAPMFRDLTQ